MKNFRASMLTLGLCLVATVASAEECCSRCGGQQKIKKVCRAVPDVKKVKVTVWDCECAEICIPGRTKTHDCQPRCGRVRTIKTLVRKEKTEEVPTFKWVIELMCAGCRGDDAGQRLSPAAADAPPPAPPPAAAEAPPPPK